MPLEWRRHRERGGDFYLAMRGDFYLAMRGEFFMATYRFESRRQVNQSINVRLGELGRGG